LATIGSAATVPVRVSTPIPALLLDTSPPPAPQSSEELFDIFPAYISQPEIRHVEEAERGSDEAMLRETGEMKRRNAKAAHSTATTTLSKPTSSASATSSPPASSFQSSGSTDACPKFISSLLSNPTFKSCYPLSMMLQVSFDILCIGHVEYTKLGLNSTNSDILVFNWFLSG
jgi:hypothetical protein